MQLCPTAVRVAQCWRPSLMSSYARYFIAAGSLAGWLLAGLATPTVGVAAPAASPTRDLVLFVAEWCGACRQTEALIKGNGARELLSLSRGLGHSSISVQYIDVDVAEAGELAAMRGRAVPEVQVRANGETIAWRSGGFSSIDELKEFVRGALRSARNRVGRAPARYRRST